MEETDQEASEEMAPGKTGLHPLMDHWEEKVPRGTVLLDHSIKFYCQGTWVKFLKGTVLHYQIPQRQLKPQKGTQTWKLTLLEARIMDLVEMVKEIKESL